MKENRPGDALDYLMQTLELEIMGNYSKNQTAQTCLNLTYVLSRLSRNAEALDYVMKAIAMFRDEIEGAKKEADSESPHEDEKFSGEETGRGTAKQEEIKKGLAMAYNNGAIEYELLGRVGEAKNMFQKALELSKEVYGADDPKTQAIEHSYNEVCRKFNRGSLRPRSAFPRQSAKNGAKSPSK